MNDGQGNIYIYIYVYNLLESTAILSLTFFSLSLDFFPFLVEFSEFFFFF